MRTAIERLCAAAAVLALGTVLAAQAADKAAEVVSVQGQGESRANESAAWRPALARQELHALNFVRTGAYSRMGLLFSDSTQVRLAEKTVMQIMAAPARPRAAFSLTATPWRTSRSAVAMEPGNAPPCTRCNRRATT